MNYRKELNEFGPSVRLSRSVFLEIAEFIYSNIGIKLSESKRSMIESRLRKRLNKLNLNSYSDYTKYLFSERGMDEELSTFIDLVTTNKTDFFREPNHFKYLVAKAIPQILNPSGNQKKIDIWSCACSRGDEPYTIAMVLSEYSLKNPGFEFSISASDISNKVLQIGREGIYEEYMINPVPYPLRKKYFLRSKNRSKKLVRIVPELRKKIRFKQINLMNRNFGFKHKMDIIFCRNVIIYFDKKTTHELIRRLCNQLKKGGFLFMGHSEILDISNLPLKSLATTIYMRI